MKTNFYVKILSAFVFSLILFSNAGAQWWKNAPVASRVAPNPATVDDTVSLFIHASPADTFSVNVYAAHDSLILTLPATGGANVLPSLAVGMYSYKVLNSNGKTVSFGTFAIRAPRVDANVRPNPSTVGDTVSIVVKAPASESFTLTISDTSGVLHTLTVNGGTTVLPALPVGVFSYALVNAAGYTVARGAIIVIAPRVHSFVQPNPSHPGDTVSIHVKAPATESFTLNIYAHGDSLVQTLTVNGGSTVLPALAPGFYNYQLVNSDGYVVSRGAIAVLPPRVHTLIAPNPSNPGEGSITVDADPTESFTLNIYNSATLIDTETVTGGTTLLPSTLTSGVYFYTVVNSDGYIVSRGRIQIY